MLLFTSSHTQCSDLSLPPLHSNVNRIQLWPLCHWPFQRTIAVWDLGISSKAMEAKLVSKTFEALQWSEPKDDGLEKCQEAERPTRACKMSNTVVYSLLHDTWYSAPCALVCRQRGGRHTICLPQQQFCSWSCPSSQSRIPVIKMSSKELKGVINLPPFGQNTG